jgi:heat shock protein HslJ
MKTTPSFLSLILMLLLVAGCSPAGTGNTTASKSSEPSGKTSKEALTQAAGQSWKLDRWTGVDGSKQNPGTITFALDKDLRVSGNASVNRYGGAIKFTETGATDFGSGFFATKMMGLPEPQAREDRYLAELLLVRSASIENGRLVLTGDGSLRFEFVPDAKSGD